MNINDDTFLIILRIADVVMYQRNTPYAIHVQDAAILAAQAAGCAAAQAAAEAGSTKARVEKAAAAATQRAAAALQLTPARVLWHGSGFVIDGRRLLR